MRRVRNVLLITATPVKFVISDVQT